MNKVKPIDLKPLNGPMDTRSTPDAVPFGGFRYIQNFGMGATNNLCKVPGWRRLLGQAESWNNQDFHDQLFSLTGQSERKPFTFLFQAVSTKKTSKLLAATDSWVGALNNRTGNWKILADDFGLAGVNAAAQVGDTVVMTDRQTAVRSWTFDQPGQLQPVPDLVTLGITQADVVVAWKDHIILMNIVEEGTYATNRLMWSDYRRPLAFMPGDDRTAGQRDLDAGEIILAALPMQNSLVIYTDKGVWEMTAVGGDKVFDTKKRYGHDKGLRCLAYRNAIVSTGDEHVYMAREGIYTMDWYAPKPQLLEWVHNASGIVFNDLNTELCDVHVAGFNANRFEVKFSWAGAGETLPSRTLVLNSQFTHSYVEDHGYTAFTAYGPDETDLVRDWLIDNCICTEEELETAGYNFESTEGRYCGDPPASAVCETSPQSIFTQTPKVETAHDGETVETEDWTATADADSLCTALDGQTVADLCAELLNTDQCRTTMFVQASAVDYGLKEVAEVYYREMIASPVGCGTYSLTGYIPILRTGPLDLKVPDADKRVSRLEVEVFPETEIVPSAMTGRVGRSGRAEDPNNPRCSIVWEPLEGIALDCLGDVSEDTHEDENTIPTDSVEWPLYLEGRFIYLELRIENTDVSPNHTGGAACLSRVSFDAVKKTSRMY